MTWREIKLVWVFEKIVSAVMFNHSININQNNNHLSTQTIENNTNKTTTYGDVGGQIYTAYKIVAYYITALSSC